MDASSGRTGSVEIERVTEVPSVAAAGRRSKLQANPDNGDLWIRVDAWRRVVRQNAADISDPPTFATAIAFFLGKSAQGGVGTKLPYDFALGNFTAGREIDGVRRKRHRSGCWDTPVTIAGGSCRIGAEETDFRIRGLSRCWDQNGTSGSNDNKTFQGVTEHGNLLFEFDCLENPYDAGRKRPAIES
jgi:hypothetical protein